MIDSVTIRNAAPDAVDVSVVMSVFNGATTLRETLDSVLHQEDCRFEFIVINDGSTDESGAILDERAVHDPRLRIIHQHNTGLTRALILGCGLATGEFLARQDCGDISLPGRLSLQCEFLRVNSGAVMTSCSVDFFGPEGEPLFTNCSPGSQLHERLSRLDARQVRGPPHHGSTMFRRSAYVQVGGYRAAFVVAQDLDLWLRLHEIGLCLGQDEVRYRARLEAGSISAARRDDQLKLTELAVDCARQRRAGGDDVTLLASRAPRPPIRRKNKRLEHARFYHFIGSCLRERDPVAARRYFLKAFRSHPLMLKSLIRYISSYQ